MILGALTSKIGGGVAWGLVIVLGLGLGWYYVTATNRAMTIKTLEQKVQLQEIAIKTTAEILKKKDQTITAMDLQIEGCFSAYEDYRDEKDVIEEVVTKIVTKPVSDIKGVADEEGSSNAIDTYNDILSGMQRPKD